MKKLLIIFTFMFLFVSLASSAELGIQARDGSGEFHGEIMMQGGQNGTIEGMQYRQAINFKMNQGLLDKEFKNAQGNTYMISKKGDNYMIQARNHSANCSNCNLSQEVEQNQTRLRVMMSNGVNAEIKVMPDVASQRAIERLSLKNCNENCTIELKEVGTNNKTTLAYNVSARQKAKFLGLFNTELDVSTQIDAQTGEVIKTKRPWWSFMASVKNE